MKIACRKSIASYHTLLRSLSFPSAVGIYHEAVMDARKEKRAACFRLDLITMHTERTTGRTSCSTGRRENETKKMLENTKCGPRGLSRARPEGQTHSSYGHCPKVGNRDSCLLLLCSPDL